MELVNGRPEDTAGRLEKEIRTYDFLDSLWVAYQRIDHEAAMTMEACEEIDKMLDATICKNLFLCNRQETSFYLLMIPGDKKFKTKELSSQIGSARLSFAKDTYMEEFLDITPGSMSVLGLMNDKENRVQLLIDEDVLKHMSEDVLVKAYFKSDASAPETLHLVEQKLGEIARMDMGFDMGSLELDTQGVREQDWAENWKKYYKPFRAGEHLVIKPSWEAYEPKEGDLVLELDPGMAFGTGTHETTFMCMEQLEKYITPGCRAIDVGCGSGILGLAAAKLGASDVLAIDLDELAVKVAAENTEKNGLSDIVRVAHGDLLEKRDEKADVIVANIIADVICYLCGPVKKHLLEGGTFICSGIIKEREDDVQHALAAAGYTVCNRLAKGEWVCLAAKLA